MRIFGMPIEILLIAIVIIVIIIVAIVVLVKVVGKSSAKATERDRAYLTISQLDDLRKRGAISEEEYQQKKDDALNRM